MRKTKRILLDFLSITKSVLDSSPRTATREEYYNHIEKYWFDLKGICKKCEFNKEIDCYYKCKKS